KNDWYVRQARKILQERAARGQEMTQAGRDLLAMFDQQSDVTRQLRAMWALYAIGQASNAWLIQQLEHSNEHLRVWAIRFLVEGKSINERALDRFISMAKEDPSSLVRLFLASSLQRLVPSARAPLAAA